eukprot:COSAG05_NODE_125_length_17331_cov_16.188058_8_plen_170_part_00
MASRHASHSDDLSTWCANMIFFLPIDKPICSRHAHACTIVSSILPRPSLRLLSQLVHHCFASPRGIQSPRVPAVVVSRGSLNGSNALQLVVSCLCILICAFHDNKAWLLLLIQTIHHLTKSLYDARGARSSAIKLSLHDTFDRVKSVMKCTRLHIGRGTPTPTVTLAPL